MHLYVQHRVIRGYRQHQRQIAGADCCYSQLNRFRRPGVHIAMLDWDHDMKAEAEEIARFSPADCRPVVCLYPYSWGFGWGAIRLARALEKKGIDVYGMVVCDGVYRHWYRCGNWRALWPWSIVHLPANVHNVELFVQDNTWLRGHAVVSAGGDLIEAKPIEEIEVPCSSGVPLRAPATHYNLDESKEWHDACVAMAQHVDAVLHDVLLNA